MKLGRGLGYNRFVFILLLLLFAVVVVVVVVVGVKVAQKVLRKRLKRNCLAR